MAKSSSSSSSSLVMLFLCMFTFSFFTSSSASDMSIISYDQTHSSSLLRTEDEVKELYESWLVKHGKSYNEKEKRFEIFKDNLNYIDEQNKLPNRSYKLGLNRFADLTNEEYKNMYLGAKPDAQRRFSRPKSERYAPKLGDTLPDSID